MNKLKLMEYNMDYQKYLLQKLRGAYNLGKSIVISLKPVYNKYLRINKINHQTPVEYGCNPNREREIIISLTSFPARIHAVHLCINTLLQQTKKPDKVILWLSPEEFPRKEEDIPASLLNLINYGLTIEWCDVNLRSYNKLLPTLKKYPDAIIVTADDDMYYPNDWLEKLYASYQENPNLIHQHTITRLEFDDKFSLKSAGRENKHKGSESYFNKIRGCSGSLYPPNTLHSDIHRVDLLLEYAPTSDDIWFWAMAVLNGTKIKWIEYGIDKLFYIEDLQKGPCLCHINDGELHLFDIHINNMLKLYPVIKEKLIDELNEHK